MTKKILCICDWGNVRSVAMAQYIKELNGKHQDFSEREEELKYEAIAIGTQVTSFKTETLLMAWADKIIDMSEGGREFIGRDDWHNPRHPELKKKVEELWKSIMN